MGPRFQGYHTPTSSGAIGLRQRDELLIHRAFQATGNVRRIVSALHVLSLVQPSRGTLQR